MNKLNLDIVLQAADKISAPLKKIRGNFSKTQTVIDKQRTQLQKLNRTQRDIQAYTKQQQAVHKSSQALHAAQTEVKKLGLAYKQTGNQSNTLSRELGIAKAKANRLQHAHQQARLKLQGYQRTINQTNISTKNLLATKAKLITQEKTLNQKLTQQAQLQERLTRSQQRRDALLSRSATLGIAGGASLGMAYGVRSNLSSMMQGVVAIEKAKGELASIGIKNLDEVVAKAQQTSSKLAGVTVDSFVKAAYDIKSGISSLSDTGVAQLTADAALTAKATKANVAQMTSLFATSYGIFKSDLYKHLSDQDFGSILSASIAQSVQQFKTDGAKLQQAIQSLGGGATKVGMSLSEQLTTLGMLQQTMQAGESGTALRAFTQNAAKAQMAFQKLAETSHNPIGIKLLDKDNRLQAMPVILTQLQQRYGDTLDALEAQEIKSAFGTEEAVKVINALYGQQHAFQANSEAISTAAKQGKAFTATMAKAMDNNLSARLQLTTQKFQLLKDKLGYALVPALENLMTMVSPLIEKFSQWLTKNQGLAKALGVTAIAIGGIAAIAAPVMLTIAALTGSFAVLAGGLPVVIAGIKGIGAALLMNPIGLTVTAIAGSALLIIKYWQPINSFFQKLWQGVQQTFHKTYHTVKQLLSFSPLSLLTKTWQPVASFFTNLWQGIRTNISHKLQGLTKKLMAPIHQLKQTLGKLWDKLFGDDEKNIRVKAQSQQIMATQKPLQQTLITPKSKTNSKPSHNQTINMPITIHAQPGMDEQAIVAQVRRELDNVLDKQQRQQQRVLYDTVAY